MTQRQVNGTPPAPNGTPCVSPVVDALESVWATIQQLHPDVPDAVITLGMGHDPRRKGLVRGRWSPSAWVSNSISSASVGLDTMTLCRLPSHHEVMIAGERLADGAVGVLSTLLHEAAHGIAHMLEIADTSRNGIYHNSRYKALAEEVGLEVSKDPRRGWTVTELAPSTASTYADQIALLDRAIRGYRGVRIPSKRPSSKSRRLLHCECQRPRKIYVSEKVADLGDIMCGVCGAVFDV